MIIGVLLAGALIGAAAGWLAGRWRASAAMRQINRALAREIQYWQDAAARSAEKAARAAEEARTWADGCRQGRQDVISIVPLLMAAQERKAGQPGAGAASGEAAGGEAASGEAASGEAAGCGS